MKPSGQVDGTDSLGGNETAGANSGEPLIIDGVEIFQGESTVDKNNSGTLGTIQFDENGNIIDTAIGKPLDLTSKFNQDSGLAGTGLPEDPQAMFDLGYSYVQTGRYQDAETVFSEYTARFPVDERNFRGTVLAGAKAILAAGSSSRQLKFIWTPTRNGLTVVTLLKPC